MIINKLALIVNDFIISLYAKGISFYQIILALIILNFIIYQVIRFVKISKYRY